MRFVFLFLFFINSFAQEKICFEIFDFSQNITEVFSEKYIKNDVINVRVKLKNNFIAEVLSSDVRVTIVSQSKNFLNLVLNKKNKLKKIPYKLKLKMVDKGGEKISVFFYIYSEYKDIKTIQNNEKIIYNRIGYPILFNTKNHLFHEHLLFFLDDKLIIESVNNKDILTILKHLKIGKYLVKNKSRKKSFILIIK